MKAKLRRLIAIFLLTWFVATFGYAATQSVLVDPATQLPIPIAGAGQTPTILNVTLTSADTEYSQALAGVKKFTIQCRTSYDVRFAYVIGKVAGPTAPYYTLKSDGIYWEDDILSASTGVTIYFASSQAGVIVEIITWS